MSTFRNASFINSRPDQIYDFTRSALLQRNRPVWLCTRNDAIGNVAVMLAALGVFGTDAGWPDIVVAVIMGVLGLSAARTVITQARAEMVHKPTIQIVARSR